MFWWYIHQCECNGAYKESVQFLLFDFLQELMFEEDISNTWTSVSSYFILVWKSDETFFFVFDNYITWSPHRCYQNTLWVHVGFKIMKTPLPPLTSPLVQTADMDSVVNHVTTAESRMMTVDHPIPDCPATQVRRRYNITPQMLRRHLSMTPFIQPNFGATLAFFSFLGWMTISSLLRWPFSTWSKFWGSARSYIQTN